MRKIRKSQHAKMLGMNTVYSEPGKYFTDIKSGSPFIKHLALN